MKANARIIVYNKIRQLPEYIQKEMIIRHTHAELCNPEEIVYKESDVLKIIETILNREI